jgi:hypothetical protein
VSLFRIVGGEIKRLFELFEQARCVAGQPIDALAGLFPNDGPEGMAAAADCSSSEVGSANPRSSRGCNGNQPHHGRGDGRSGGGRNSVQDRRIIDGIVDSVTVEQSGLAITLNPEVAAGHSRV